MKFIIALVTLFALARADVYSDFVDWTIQHGKAYNDAYEHATRLQNYKANAALVAHLNRQGRGEFALNQFADLSQEEFERIYLRPYPVPAFDAERKTLPYNPFRGYPDALDWRDTGAVTPVKNQGQCGSCWAFSATGNMEGVTKITTGKLPDLAEQQLVDCEHDCMIFPGTTQKVCDEGCSGGLMPNAFTYAIREGMTTQDLYPYTGRDGKCKTDVKRVHYYKSWAWVGDNETAMVAALNDVGPLSVAVDATYWSYYSGGIYDSSCSSTRMNHGVTLIGYGSVDGKSYWLIKNSWGTGWGEKGYMRLIRGKNKCGIENFVCTVSP